MAQRDKEHGEGNYRASREYNEAAKRFIDAGRVEQAARDAAPADDAEAKELARAEAEGARRAREEDRELRAKTPTPRERDPRGVQGTDRPADQPNVPPPGQDKG